MKCQVCKKDLVQKAGWFYGTASYECPTCQIKQRDPRADKKCRDQFREMLVRQEIAMYKIIGQYSDSEIDHLCNLRGFDSDERDVLEWCLEQCVIKGWLKKETR